MTPSVRQRREPRPLRSHGPQRAAVLGGLALLLSAVPSLWAQMRPVAEPLPGLFSPHARRLISGAQDRRVAAAAMQHSPRSQPDGLLSLWVQAEGGAAALNAAGLAAQEVTPSFARVTLPPSELRRLWRLPGLRRVDGERVLRPRLDRSVPLIGGKALHELGLRGRGVMIAIVDTGVDFRHPDLRDAAGHTRISYLLQAGVPRRGRHPELPDSNDMVVYTAADLDAVLEAEAAGKTPENPISEKDESGHGTHVAGIAAGTGLGTGRGQPRGRYVGVAPEASLCIVKGTRENDSFSDIDILFGVRFCAEQAEALGMPVVVNLSLGSLGGPHDGGSALEAMLDEIMTARRGPGATSRRPARLLVAAAGNSGNDDIHASGRLLDGSHDIAIRVEPANSIAGKTSMVFEIYYEAAAPHSTSGVPELAVELRSPGGRVLRAALGDSVQGRFGGEGDAIIDNSDLTPATSSGPVPLRGGFILLSSESESTAIKSGTWSLRLIGRTLRYDVWLSDMSAEVSASLASHLDPDGYVEIPAAASSAISVGAFRSRLDWVRPSGAKVNYERELNRVAPFSSAGPVRDGRFAPDILAPGEFIVSTLSIDAYPGMPRSVFSTAEGPDYLQAEDGVHAVLRGTSQATPHVAGGLALLLQLRPDLSIAQARELLRTTGKTDLALPSYGPRRGFGLLDLKAAVAALRGSPTALGEVSPLQSDLGSNLDQLIPGYGEAILTVTPRDATGLPLGPGHEVELLSDAGTFVGPVRYVGSPGDSFGRYERRLRASGPRGTVATVVARIDGITLQRRLRLHFVTEGSAVGAPYVLGGCSYAGRATPAAWPLSLLALSLLALVARRRLPLSGTALLGMAAGSWLVACSEPEPGGVGSSPGPTNSLRPSGQPRPRFPIGGDYFWQAGELLNSPSVRIYLSAQYADIFDGPSLVGRSSICSGRRSHRTPSGKYTVTEKIAEHLSNRYGDYVDENGQIVQANIDALGSPPPPGTVFRGTKMPYFLRILGGIGLHAGPLPGFPDSHGCIRFPETIAQRLYSSASVGMPVLIED